MLMCFESEQKKNTPGILLFFLNDRTLDADTLIKQILYVITCHELAGLQVQSLVSDVGGDNFHVFDLLTKGQITKLMRDFV